MKICFLTNTPFVVGGVERVLTVVANMLSQTHEVTILCTESENLKKVYELDDKIKVEIIDNLKNKKINYFFRKVLRKVNSVIEIPSVSLLKAIYFPGKENKKYIKALYGRFDAVIGVQDSHTLQLAVIADRLNCMCFGWFHNSCTAYFETPGCYSWHREELFRKFMKNLKICVTLTDGDCKKFSQYIGDYFCRIYNPLTCEVLKKELPEDIDILFVGRLLRQQKGLDLFLDIVQLVSEKIPGLRCFVVGSGQDNEYLKGEIDKRTLKHVIFLEGETDSVAHYYNRAKIVVNTSRWEGFGLVITEAMAHSVPVVAFRTAGPSEIIIDGDCGYLIDCFDTVQFAERVITLLTDEKLRRVMGQQCVKRAYDFSPDRIQVLWEEMLTCR